MRKAPSQKTAGAVRKERVMAWCFLVSLIVTTTLVYRLVPTFDFVNLDDHLMIFQNYSVRHFDWQRALTSSSAGLYHPLTTLTFLSENLAFGLDSKVYHLNNLILHLFNVFLVYVLAKSLTQKRLDAFWLAAFFALNPLSVESVAWVAERKDVLSTFFFLLSCLAYRWTLTNHNKGLYWSLTSVFATCAYMAKPSTVILPVIFFWIDWVENRPLTKRSVLEKLPFFAASTFVLAINWQVQTALRGHPAWPEPVELVASPMRAVVFYFTKLMAPVNLSISYPTGPDLISLGQWVSAASFSLVLFWVASDRRFKRPIQLSGTWFAIILLPMLKVVPFGDLSPVNDRFMYLAGPGFGYLLWTMWKKFCAMIPALRLRRSVLPIVPAAFLIFYAHLAYQRTLAWRSTETIWMDVLKTYPEDGRAHANLARYYQSVGKVNDSVLHFRKAVEFKGDKLPVLLADLAYLHIENNRDQDARELLDLAKAEDPTDPRVLNIEGVYLWRRGDLLAAEIKLKDALARPPGLSAAEQRAKIMNNLGLVLAAKGDFSGAVDMYKKALDLQPDEASTVYNLGLVYLNSRKLDDAVMAFHRAITINPQLAEAWADLGVTYFAKADLEKSAYFLRKAVEKSPTHIRARHNLSIILTKLGQCQEARALMQVAPGGESDEETWPKEVKACGGPR